MPEGFFQAMVEQSQELRVILTPEGRVIYVSPSVLELLGYETEQFLRLPAWSWVHPEGYERMRPFLTASSSPPKLLLSRFRHLRGFWLDCSVAVQPFDWQNVSQDSIQESEHFAERTGDIFLTIQKLEDTVATVPVLSQKIDATEETEPAKSKFLAIMSHELRTPINAINGFSQLLLRQRQGLLTSEQKDMVQRILTNGKNLLHLINNVLDMSKLEAGRMHLHLEDINVVDLIESTVQEISSLATQSELSLQTEIDLFNPIISNDPIRLRQILVNLLSNALKFTDEGEVWVIVEEAESEEIWISVQDTGPGIAPRDIDRVFSEFWQVEHCPGRQYQGTGLGLAIAHNLAKMMQGDIHVHSQLGQGSTFRLVIPRYLKQNQVLTSE